MNDKLFDEKIKAALDNLEAPYDASSWAALEQRLNAPLAEEQPAPVDEVDKAVFRTLERLEAPYQPAHWDLLAQRMTTAARQRRRVWISKLSEAAIFLLLLVNLDGLLDSGSAEPATPAVPQVPASKRLQAHAPAAQRHENDRTLAAEALSQGESARNAQNWAGAATALFQVAPYLNTKEMPAAATADHHSNSTAPDNLIESAPAHWASVENMMTLPSLPGGQVARANPDSRNASPVHVKAPKQHRFYAVTFANFDRNQVRSASYSNTSNGHGGGMAIGYRIGKWGAEAGLSYNRRHYQPQKEVEIYDITADGLYGSYAKSVDADFVSVPVKVTRRVAQWGQTTAHATAGVTANIAVDKSYQYGSVYYPAPSASGNPAPPTDQKPKLRKNGQGALENGSLRGNVYASADLGVRLEQPIGRHLTAFAEPTYRMALGKKGIGPNPAKVNTFSVQAGVLATL